MQDKPKPDLVKYDTLLPNHTDLKSDQLSSTGWSIRFDVREPDSTISGNAPLSIKWSGAKERSANNLRKTIETGARRCGIVHCARTADWICTLFFAHFSSFFKLWTLKIWEQTACIQTAVKFQENC